MRLSHLIIPCFTILKCVSSHETETGLNASRPSKVGAYSGLRVIQQDPAGENAAVPAGTDADKGEGADGLDEEEMGLTLPVMFMLLAFAGCMLKKRMSDNNAYKGRWIVGTQDPDENDDYNMRSLNGHGGNEMIPLSNEDEWGWEDNARKDLEMGAVGGSKNKEDLNTVLATAPPPSSVTGSEHTFKTSNLANGRNRSSTSLNSQSKVKASAPKTFSSNGTAKTLGKATPSLPAKSLSNKVEDSWDQDSDWDEEETSVPVPVSMSSAPATQIPKSKKSPPMAPKTAPAPPPALTVEELLAEQLKNSHAPAITSLAKKSAAKPKPKPRAAAKKNAEEDIFASMGLSSVPKKSAPASASISKPSTASAKTASASSDKSNLAASVIDTGSAASDWGDDGDLDDLLDE